MYVCDAHYNADHQEWWSNQTYSHDVSSYIIMHYLIMCCPLAGCNLFSIVSCSFNSTAACCQFTKAHGAKLKVQAPSWHSWTWAVIGRCPVRPIFCGAFTYDFGQLSAAESSAQMSKCILVAAHLQRKPCTGLSSKSLISFSVQPSCGATWSRPTKRSAPTQTCTITPLSNKRCGCRWSWAWTYFSSRGIIVRLMIHTLTMALSQL